MHLASSFAASLFTLGLFVSGCSDETSSPSTSAAEGTPATSALHASFIASTTDSGLRVAASVYTIDPLKFVRLSASEQFVVELNGARTPMTLDGGSDAPGDEPMYLASIAAPPAADAPLRIAFERGAGGTSAPASTVSMPGDFEIVDAPASFAEGDEVAFRLSREVTDDAVLIVGAVSPTGGCLTTRGATFHAIRRDAATLTYKVEGLPYAGSERSCEVGATIMITRTGSVDPAFAPGSTFEASVQHAKNLQLVQR